MNLSWFENYATNMPFRVASDEYVSSGPLVPQNVILARRDATAIPRSLNSGSIFMRKVNPLPDGRMQFFLPSQPDENYVIQATTDFVTWLNN